ncbi:MAG: hypothetical protein J6Q92_08685 [Oscillospiraceae bacterium]|nr:hypothetical protein [Oscillospiraceae bacterium]
MKNKLFIIGVVVILALATVSLLLFWGVIPSPGGSDSTEMLSTNNTTTKQTEATTTTAETIPEDPTIYPEEMVQFQSPEKAESHSQTDILNTLDNNVYMDALVYTGYNIKKHRSDGMMWKFVPAEDKAKLGYLSDITYGGGSTGYETTDEGKPNIQKFENRSLVCASFVTYVYLNYMPNVAGIDTSALGKPGNSLSANSWYSLAKKWVKNGYSESIPFYSKAQGAIGSAFIKFKPEKDIPVGSLIFFCNPKLADKTEASHVAIFAGYKNGYYWLYHVGNKNGPEFCAVQRMNFGPNARWPIAIITPPNTVRFSPVLEIELVDKAGKPISGSEFILKHPKTGKELSLGVTDAEGKLVREDLGYGDYELVQVVPEGYSCEKTTNKIKISGVNNSLNKVLVVNTKVQ